MVVQQVLYWFFSTLLFIAGYGALLAFQEQAFGYMSGFLGVAAAAALISSKAKKQIADLKTSRRSTPPT